MKRYSCFLLVLVTVCVLAAAAAGEGFEEADIEIEDLLQIEQDLLWTFPVKLEDMNPEYIRVVNKHYTLPEDYVPDNLVKVPKSPENGGIYWKSAPDGGHKLQEACADALCRMNADMREIDGFQDMYLKSAYRSYQTQNTMYKNRLASHNGKDDGWVAKPGASDHQTGLGCDVIPFNWTKKSGMNEKMMKEKECQWMAEHCQEYGFIIRYPLDKKEITEINMEPWHLRYVGVPAATYIMENGLCLEEFNDQLQEAIQDYIARGGDPARVEPFIQTPTNP